MGGKSLGCIVYLIAGFNLWLISLTLHVQHFCSFPADCAPVKLHCPQTLNFIEEQIEHMEGKKTVFFSSRC